MRLSRLLLITAFALSTGYEEVCYPHVGCFNNYPPYDNAKGVLPDSPDGQHVRVFLYTRKLKDSGISLRYNDLDLMTTLSNAYFDLDKDTKFITHGFGGSSNSGWVLDLKDALLDKGDFNVMIVDWKKAAKMPNYYQAVANIRVAGAELHIFLETMRKGGVDLSTIHLIGHSLGAQLFADVGRRMNGTIGRLTALDAASPLFEDRSPEVRLDKTDAMFVDVIHTDGDDLGVKGGAGINQVSGHVDFYPNGGKNQPGCFDHTLVKIERSISSDVFSAVSCSHHRSVEFLIESIKSDCPFTAYPCSDYDTYKKGDCHDCSNNSCNVMGFHADPAKGKGSLYVRTNSKKPFCGTTAEPSSSSATSIFCPANSLSLSLIIQLILLQSLMTRSGHTLESLTSFILCLLVICIV